MSWEDETIENRFSASSCTRNMYLNWFYSRNKYNFQLLNYFIIPNLMDHCIQIPKNLDFEMSLTLPYFNETSSNFICRHIWPRSISISILSPWDCCFAKNELWQYRNFHSLRSYPYKNIEISKCSESQSIWHFESLLISKSL